MEGQSSCLFGYSAMMGFGENNNSSSNNSNNNDNRSNGGGGGGGGCFGGNAMMIVTPSSPPVLQRPAHGEEANNKDKKSNDSCYMVEDETSMKAKIMAHPHFARLLNAYVNCQKVGAPPEVVAQLEEVCVAAAAASKSSSTTAAAAAAAAAAARGGEEEEPALDQFMEAYSEMLTKYAQELTKPLEEAMLFLSRIDSQFKALTLTSPSPSSAFARTLERNGSSEDEVDAIDNGIDPLAEDRELKGQLLRKYSGYFGSLKQEFLKKRKKGKLPKEARQQLLDWWGRHYKWPYPSESQKLALAESTGLDQKQINNWFINQRKRHWKPSEEMQFVVMDASQPTHYYMDDNLLHFPMDCTSTLL